MLARQFLVKELGYSYQDGLGVNHFMNWGAFPIKADRDVTGKDKETYNLILIGNPAENSLISTLASSYASFLPFTFHHSGRSYDGVTINGTVYDGAGYGWQVLSPNPQAPTRYALFVSEQNNASTGKYKYADGVLVADWSIQKSTPTSYNKFAQVAMGVFDEDWSLGKSKKR